MTLHFWACVWNFLIGQYGKPSGWGESFSWNPDCCHNSSGPCIYAVPNRPIRMESHSGYSLHYKRGFHHIHQHPPIQLVLWTYASGHSLFPQTNTSLKLSKLVCSSDIQMLPFRSGIHCQHGSDKKTKRRSNWILIYLESIIDKSWYWHKSWVLTIK